MSEHRYNIRPNQHKETGNQEVMQRQQLLDSRYPRRSEIYQLPESTAEPEHGVKPGHGNPQMGPSSQFFGVKQRCIGKKQKHWNQKEMNSIEDPGRKYP